MARSALACSSQGGLRCGGKTGSDEVCEMLAELLAKVLRAPWSRQKKVSNQGAKKRFQNRGSKEGFKPEGQKKVSNQRAQPPLGLLNQATYG